MRKKENAIIFIDGNNIYHNLKGTYIKPSIFDFQKLSSFVCAHFNLKHKRTIYYNSIPNIEDGKEMYYSHMKFLDGIKKLPNFELKTRKLQHNSTKEKIQVVHSEVSKLGLCKVCEPLVKTHWEDYIGSTNVKEKGIDIQIAVDMIKSLLIDKEYGACVLISGDADFIPVLELLKSNNRKVFTCSLAKGYSYDLRKKFPWFILDKKLVLDKLSKD